MFFVPHCYIKIQSHRDDILVENDKSTILSAIGTTFSSIIEFNQISVIIFNIEFL